MKKLIAILLMLTLLCCLLPCYAAASAAPATDADNAATDGGSDTASDENEAADEQGFKFEPSQFVDNLYYMGVGMVGIFLVIGIIIIATMLLNRIFSGKAKE